MTLVADAPRTHVINRLLDELESNGVAVDDETRDAARVLERFYAPTRYPDALGGIEPGRIFRTSDATEAIAHADRVLAFVRGLDERRPDSPIV